ncbi:MAG: hypothetical protein RLZZ186_1855 [Cyanobacteriota bacterium]
MIKTLKPFLPGQMGIAEQALAARHQAVLTLLLAEGIEELGRAPAFCLSLLAERLPMAAKAREFQLFEQQRQGRFHRLRAGNR